MFSAVYGYIGIVSVMCLVAAFSVHKFPKFKTEAFKSKPPEEQHRAIRNMRIVWAVLAFLCLGVIFVLGFVKGYTDARTNRDSVHAWFQQLQSEGAGADAELVRVEKSMENMLVPERLVTQEGVTEARKRLADWADTINRWEARKREIVTRAESTIPQLDMPQLERDDMLASFRRAVADVRPLTDEFTRAKREIIAAAGQKLDLLQAPAGPVTLRNGQLYFANPVDAQKDAAIEKRLEAAAKREEAFAQKLEDRAQATQKKAKEVFGK